MAQARRTKDDDDDDDGPRIKPGSNEFFEFDCPECNANNPWPDGFKAKDEVQCHYCGVSFDVKVTDEGKLKLKS